MKAQIIRDDMEISPAFVNVPELQDRIVRVNMMRDGYMQDVAHWKNGAVIEFPDCWRLVQQGCAIPADEGCALRCRMTTEQMHKAQYAYERLIRRIDPEDFDLYDNGVMTGYDDKGDYVPGPNWADLSKYRSTPGVLSDDLSEDEA